MRRSRTRSRRILAAWVALPVLLALRCGAPIADREPDAAGPVFADVTTAAGIVHRHEKPILDAKLANIMPWMTSVGAAVAAGDYDNDGRVDLYVTNSRKGRPNFLYRNNGDGTFQDVAAAAGLADVNDERGVSTDCVWADFDNDGWQDLYLVRWGRDTLYRNNGDGTFRDVTASTLRDADGTAGTPWANGDAVIALDFDLDGRLDFYVGNYFKDVDLWHLETTLIMHDDFEIARNAGRNVLYRQQADGTFVDVAPALGVDDTGWTLAVGAGDLNNDGRPDLYVANDFGPDRLYYGNGRGGFTDVTNLTIGRDTRKGMNVDVGDFNNDGWLDVYVTNITTAEYLQEGNMLWRNNGPGDDGVTRFMDVSPESGTYDGGWGWGAKFLDADNDGDLDLFAVNGFVSAGEGSYWYDLATFTVQEKDSEDARSWPPMGDRSFSGYEAFRFWRNDGFESFSERAEEVGLASDRDGRGVACLDYDDDGDLDVFVANQGQAPQLFRNDLPAGSHWLRVQLQGVAGPASTADAIGARVTVVAGGRMQIRERDGGNGFSAQSDPRLHFGLGDRDTAELVEVRWPDGGVQYVENVAANRPLAIRQDPAQYAARSLVPAEKPVPRAPTHEAAPAPQIDPAELDRLLTTYEDGLRGDPGDLALAHAYRMHCAEYAQHDRAVAFFTALAERYPDNDRIALERSVTFIDKIPTCGGLAAIVCKGTLARKSLDVLNEIVEKRPDWWTARYARGMNHLHWPRALRHTPAAIADFLHCLDLQEREGDPAGHAYYERTYVLLGDAHAKDKAFDDAARVWRRGLELFPGSSDLAARVALEPAEMLDFVESARSLERPIDTDFSFVTSDPEPQAR